MTFENCNAKPPRGAGRPPRSQNKVNVFKLDYGMEILHEVARRPEHEGLSRHQVIDEAARIIYSEVFKGRDLGEQFRKSTLASIQKRLEREQRRRDDDYLTQLISTHENSPDDVEICFGPDPLDAEAPPIILGVRSSRDRDFEELERQDLTLPQGVSPTILAANLIRLETKQSVVKRRKLKGR